VRLSGSIQKDAFAPKQLVTYRVTLRNLGHTSCGYSKADELQDHVAPGSMLLGPCAALSVVIENAQGIDEYPGSAGMACPAFLGPLLTAHGTLHATGIWDLRRAFEPGRPFVPPGHYRLTLAERITLPFTIGAARSARSGSVAPLGAPVTWSVASDPASRSVHVAFEGCAAKNVIVSVTLPTQLFTARPVIYGVSIHNIGDTACGTSLPHHDRAFFVGGCGAIYPEIVNLFGVNVFPGPAAFSCPAFGGAFYLPPHTTASARGSWNTEEYLATPGSTPQWHQAPSGTYHLSLTIPTAADGSALLNLPFTWAPSP
jgi:hypothetical protein